jgi:2-oxoglutarate ferredoxin oxidoreductase subunit gamma
MSQDALDDNWKLTAPNASLITESGLVKTDDVRDRKVFAVPVLNIAEELGRKVVANIVILGFLTATSGIASRDAMISAIMKRYPKAAELNRRAFDRGFALPQKVVS